MPRRPEVSFLGTAPANMIWKRVFTELVPRVAHRVLFKLRGNFESLLSEFSVSV